jgi:hypothetical protein
MLFIVQQLRECIIYYHLIAPRRYFTSYNISQRTMAARSYLFRQSNLIECEIVIFFHLVCFSLVTHHRRSSS